MLRDFLTPEAFEIGIIKYLKRFSYQNTVNSHLWESLTDVSDGCVGEGEDGETASTFEFEIMN